MKKLLLIVSCLCTLPFWAAAQIGCADGRYIQEVFTNFTLSSNITYGSNYNLQGSLQSLELDIYEPTGDTETERPLIVLQHGGSFISGSKTGADIVDLAEPLARRGFVVASVEYRLGMGGLPFPGPDSTTASEAVWRAVADFKAAVRFFYKSARDNGNTYRIDTNNIFIGGVSAGAVSAVHYAYLDDVNEIPSYIDTTGQGMGGGIEGSSGNPGYSSRPRGVINLCGMLADTAWMQPGDEPIVSLHGTNDNVVPYGTAMISVSGFWNIFVVDGSSSVHAKADQIGLTNCLHTWEGAGHTPEIGSAAYLDTALKVITNFVKPIVCGGSAQCGYVVGVDQQSDVDFGLFPNPSQGKFQVAVPEFWTGTWNCQLMDATGRVVGAWQDLEGHYFEVNAERLPAGIYHVRIQNAEATGTSKLVLIRQ